MGLFSKILFGGLGWAAGGPIGALIGVAIATLFSSSNNTREKTEAGKRRTAQNDFKVAMLVLMAAVMKADGNIVKSELSVVKRYLMKYYGEAEALEALSMLRELLKRPIDANVVAMQIGMNVSYSVRLQLLYILFEIALSDSGMTERETAVIKQIADAMRVSDIDFRSVRAMFNVDTNKNTNKNWAYDILEITKGATDDEVKKAYRRMAMKYHPDKLSGMGEDVKLQSVEKFRKVKEAYEYVKSERNMK